MSFFRKLLKLNFRSIFLNFWLLPVSQAIKLPLLFSRKTVLKGLYRGCIKINSENIFSGMIQIGFNIAGIIDYRYERTLLEILKGGVLVCSGKVIIGSGCRLSIGENANLIISDDFSVTGKTSIICWKKISFGSSCRVSWNCSFMDTDFHKIYYENSHINQDEEIFIGNKVWICNNTQILKGTTIPDNCVIGAGSLITKKLNEVNCIYAGNPVKKVRENITWEE